MREMVMALVFGLLATACSSSTTTTTAGSAPVDTATPPVVAAASARAAIASGQPTVLLFTQVGCASCVAVAKAMAAAAAGRPDVHLVGIDMTGSDDAATLRSFLADVMGSPSPTATPSRSSGFPDPDRLLDPPLPLHEHVVGPVDHDLSHVS